MNTDIVKVKSAWFILTLHEALPFSTKIHPKSSSSEPSSEPSRSSAESQIAQMGKQISLAGGKFYLLSAILKLS